MEYDLAHALVNVNGVPVAVINAFNSVIVIIWV